jgi:ankyrin repeat protein
MFEKSKQAKRLLEICAKKIITTAEREEALKIIEDNRNDGSIINATSKQYFNNTPLIHCIAYNHHIITDALCNVPCIDFNHHGSNGTTALLQAVNKPDAVVDIKLIEKILNHASTVPCVADKFGNTAAHIAARIGNVEVINLLLPKLQKLLDTKARDEKTGDSYNVLIALIQTLHRAMELRRDREYISKLHYCIEYVIEKFSEEAINSRFVTIKVKGHPAYDYTALMLAARYNLEEVAKRLILNGANISLSAPNGDNAFSIAKAFKAKETLTLITEVLGELQKPSMKFGMFDNVKDANQLAVLRVEGNHLKAAMP